MLQCLCDIVVESHSKPSFTFLTMLHRILTVAAQGHILSEVPVSFLWSMSSPLFSDWGEMESQDSTNLLIPDG